MTVRLRLCRCGQHHPMGVSCPQRPSFNERYGSRYRRAARLVVESATVCHICGGPANPDDPFTADHVFPIAWGGVDSPLMAAHESCNKRAGQKLTQ